MKKFIDREGKKDTKKHEKTESAAERKREGDKFESRVKAFKRGMNK